LSEILAHGLLWLDVLRDYHGSIRSHNFRRFVTEGGLISFGIDQAALYRLAASYVDRILKGEKPADLPVQAPTKYETVLNIKTAKALGLEAPPSVFARADEVNAGSSVASVRPLKSDYAIASAQRQFKMKNRASGNTSRHPDPTIVAVDDRFTDR
jgi:hypothetical protein